MSIENIRLSQTGRDQLVQLKRLTGIKQWNILSRWGLCASLAEQSPPRPQPIPADSTVEMTWRTFGGPQDEIYRGLILDRYVKEGDDSGLSEAEHFRLHLHRGIGYLAGDPRRKSIAGLLRIAIDAVEAREETPTNS